MLLGCDLDVVFGDLLPTRRLAMHRTWILSLLAACWHSTEPRVVTLHEECEEPADKENDDPEDEPPTPLPVPVPCVAPCIKSRIIYVSVVGPKVKVGFSNGETHGVRAGWTAAIVNRNGVTVAKFGINEVNRFNSWGLTDLSVERLRELRETTVLLSP